MPRKYFSGGINEAMAADPAVTDDGKTFIRAFRAFGRIVKFITGFFSSGNTQEPQALQGPARELLKPIDIIKLVQIFMAKATLDSEKPPAANNIPVQRAPNIERYIDLKGDKQTLEWLRGLLKLADFPSKNLKNLDDISIDNLVKLIEFLSEQNIRREGLNIGAEQRLMEPLKKDLNKDLNTGTLQITPEQLDRYNRVKDSLSKVENQINEVLGSRPKRIDAAMTAGNATPQIQILKEYGREPIVGTFE